MYYLYILESQKDLGYYIGVTDNLEKRLKQHNNRKVRSTKNRVPLVLKHFESFSSKNEARKREILLKKNYQIRKELLVRLGFSIK